MMKNPQQQYQEQAIKNASPTELITKLYDFAIQACYQENNQRLDDVLSALTQSLNFDYEISDTLYELYDYCKRQGRNKEFDEVRELLMPVREAWVDGVVANKNKKPASIDSKGFVV